MASDGKGLRGVVLCEDKRTEQFVRALLRDLGFTPRNFRFDTAPKGEGAGEAWVRARYPGEVKVLRVKKHQKGLRLVAVRDADTSDPARRKQELDDALTAAGMTPRDASEKVATPVPARNIETWLLALLGVAGLDETTDYKPDFERDYKTTEKAAINKAAVAWRDINSGSLPSLRDGVAEMKRIDP